MNSLPYLSEIKNEETIGLWADGDESNYLVFNSESNDERSIESTVNFEENGYPLGTTLQRALARQSVNAGFAQRHVYFQLKMNIKTLGK